MSEENRFYIRPAAEADQPMEGFFKLEGIEVALYVHDDLRVTVHKIGVRGKPNAKPIAVGEIRANSVTTPNAPQVVGTLRTLKDSLFALSLWKHIGLDTEPYYAARIETKQLRRGKFIEPTKAA